MERRIDACLSGLSDAARQISGVFVLLLISHCSCNIECALFSLLFLCILLLDKIEIILCLEKMCLLAVIISDSVGGASYTVCGCIHNHVSTKVVFT